MKNLWLLALLALLIAPALATAQTTAELSWTPPARYLDGPGGTPGTAIDPKSLTYNVFQGAQGSAKTKAGNTAPGVATYSVPAAALPVGTTQCWQVSAVSAGGTESGLSNEACKAVPWPTPAAPSAVTVIIVVK